MTGRRAQLVGQRVALRGQEDDLGVTQDGVLRHGLAKAEAAHAAHAQIDQAKVGPMALGHGQPIRRRAGGVDREMLGQEHDVSTNCRAFRPSCQRRPGFWSRSTTASAKRRGSSAITRCSLSRTGRPSTPIDVETMAFPMAMAS